jgi:hypothetical protein
VFSKNRDRLREGDIAAKFPSAVRAQPEVKKLLSNDHFSVDGTLIEAWASMQSVKPKDGSGEPPAGGAGRNAEADFHGQKRTNDTHASTTDPDARLYKKGKGKEAKQCSSLKRGATVDLMPGDYTVVATRPSGEQLIAPTTVGPNGGDAVVAMSGASPREFLTEAADLGLTYAPKASAPDDYRVTSLASPLAANTAARSMSVLLRKQYVPGRFDSSLGDDQLASINSTVRSLDYRLMCWRLSHGRWQTCPAPVPRYSDDYLQLAVTERHSPTAIGLLCDDGFGPIVIVPPLWPGIVLTFIAAGLNTGWCKSRNSRTGGA